MSMAMSTHASDLSASRASAPGVFFTKPTKMYEYNMIDPKREMRILNLFHGAEDTPLNGCLTIKPLPVKAQAYTYRALSGAWGEGPVQDVIKLYPFTIDDDQNATEAGTFYIGPNLAMALKALRSPHQDILIWVDFLCINQADRVEKTAQDKRIFRMYKRAEIICIWLGQYTTNKAEETLEFLQDIFKPGDFSRVVDSRATPEKWKIVLDLMKNRWFARLWISKELALVNEAEVRWESAVLYWSDYSGAINLFSHKYDEVANILSGDGIEVILRGTLVATRQGWVTPGEWATPPVLTERIFWEYGRNVWDYEPNPDEEQRVQSLNTLALKILSVKKGLQPFQQIQSWAQFAPKSIFDTVKVATTMLRGSRYVKPKARSLLCGIKNTLERRFRPAVIQGFRRLEWICDCGESLYMDFNSDSIADSPTVNALINSQSANLQTSGNPHAAAQSGSSAVNRPIPTRSKPSFSQISPNRSTSDHESNPPKSLQNSISTSTATNTVLPPSQPVFLELCVNTGKYIKSLREIDVASITTDGDFFNTVKSHYLRLRGFRTKFWLLKPLAVSYVRFSVEERWRVGILHKPIALPPKIEVDAKRYLYSPCPLDDELPISSDLFLHYLFSCSSPSKSLVWLPRIPRKLDTSILSSAAAANFGWGVHIDEGPDYLKIMILNLVLLLLSGGAALLWVFFRNDFQGAMGLAAWIVMLSNTLMAVFIAM